MKKIIKRKMYNTETATKIASYGNAGSRRNFSHFDETLYRKQNGEFFLLGVGGPASKYSVSVGTNLWSGSTKIIPLCDNEAKEWLKSNGKMDAYATIFGEA